LHWLALAHPIYDARWNHKRPVSGLLASREQYYTGPESRGKVMKVTTDVLQQVLHYSKHIWDV
jgi:hypothetical protein